MRVSRMQAAENRETVVNVASSASSERHLAGVEPSDSGNLPRSMGE